MTEQEFKEIKERYALIHKMIQSNHQTDLTDGERDLLNKWLPIDIHSMLINHVEELQEKLGIAVEVMDRLEDELICELGQHGYDVNFSYLSDELQKLKGGE